MTLGPATDYVYFKLAGPYPSPWPMAVRPTQPSRLGRGRQPDSEHEPKTCTRNVRAQAVTVTQLLTAHLAAVGSDGRGRGSGVRPPAMRTAMTRSASPHRLLDPGDSRIFDSSESDRTEACWSAYSTSAARRRGRAPPRSAAACCSFRSSTSSAPHGWSLRQNPKRVSVEGARQLSGRWEGLGFRV